MAKRLTRIEMKILANQLERVALTARKRAEADYETLRRIHDARLMALNAKFLRKHGKQILALATIDTAIETYWDDPTREVARKTYDMDTCTPLAWSKDTLEARKQIAAEYREFMQEMDFYPIRTGETTYLHFPALDETILVPTSEIQQWKNLADKIDMAVIDGDAKKILDIIQEFTKS